MLPLVEETLTIARYIPNHHFQAEQFAELIPLVPPEQRAALAREGLDAVWHIEDKLGREHNQVYALSYLVPHLSGNLLDEALALARGITRASLRAEALAHVAGALAESRRKDVLQEALDSAWVIDDVWSQTEAAASFYVSLAHSGKAEEALSAALALPPGGTKAEALADIALFLEPQRRDDVLAQAIAVARAIDWPPTRGDVLGKIVLRLSDNARAPVLESIFAQRGKPTPATRTPIHSLRDC